MGFRWMNQQEIINLDMPDEALQFIVEVSKSKRVR
jgi:hypothetical protein